MHEQQILSKVQLKKAKYQCNAICTISVWVIQVDISVQGGCIGALFVANDLKTVFSNVDERGPTDARVPMILVLDRKPDGGWLVLRNNAVGLNRSECEVSPVQLFRIGSPLRDAVSAVP